MIIIYNIQGENDKTEKKLGFIEDVVDMKDGAEKKEEEIIETDEIMKLQIPEIIWMRALEDIKESNIIDIDIKFLTVLYKHGKTLPYKAMRDAIITHINNNITSDIKKELIQSRIICAKLEKYEKKVNNFYLTYYSRTFSEKQ